MSNCKLYKTLLNLALFAAPMVAHAQASTPEAKTPETTIVDQINSSAHHEIDGPADILKLLSPNAPGEDKSTTAPVKKSGPRMRTVYRVQVLSVNQSGNGRALAEKRRRAVSSRFPQYPCDLAFEAPNWKVRVGIFENQNEANAAASNIRQALSQFAKEVRVVRVNMKVTR